METLWNGIHMVQADFPLGTDSVLLANFISLPKNARVADLGSGAGTLGLLLCAGNSSCHVTGVELDPAAHRLALENIRSNRLQARMTALNADVRELSGVLPANAFDWVVSNPPYFPPGSGKLSEKHTLARCEETLTLEQLCAAAARLLPTGGRFALVHRPERLCDIFCALRQNGMEPKRLQFVRHRADAPVCLILLEARRGGRPGLQYEPDFIEFTPTGGETEAYRAAYHRGDTQ